MHKSMAANGQGRSLPGPGPGTDTEHVTRPDNLLHNVTAFADRFIETRERYTLSPPATSNHGRIDLVWGVNSIHTMCGLSCSFWKEPNAVSTTATAF